MASQFTSLNCPFLRGFPITKESAEEVYCGLDKNWWKQLYDGKYQHFGPEVFDKGLHGRAEPGFYESAFKAFEFAKRHLTEKLSLEFYRDLHKEACAHFQGKENRTRMQSGEAGRFRYSIGRSIKCTFQVETMLKVFGVQNIRKRLIRQYCFLRKNYGDEIVKICADETTLKENKWYVEFTITAAQAQEIENLIQKKFQTLGETLNEWAKDPVIKNAVPRITLIEDKLRIDYSRAELERNNFYVVISKLFDAFNRTLSEVNEELNNASSNEQEKIDSLVERKLVLIANLYQNLEWVHPYPDGQGRTDLLLLGKLLSENGFTPAILHDPYMSSFSSREDWLAYLKKGMQKWDEERNRVLGTL